MTFRMNVRIGVLGVLFMCVSAVGGGVRRARVVGGTMPLYNQFSFIVEIVVRQHGRDPKHLCGGSLVTLEWILTAAHCYHTEVQGLEYYAGISKLDSSMEYTEDGSIKFINGQTRSVKWTQKPFRFDSLVSTVYLPLKEEEDDLSVKYKYCFSAGWGNSATNVMRMYDSKRKAWFYNKDKYYTQSMVQVLVPLISNNQCRRIRDFHSGIFFNVKATQMCTLYYPGRKAMCRGDSGGPLICGNQQYGITSWSFSCGKSRTGADVFTRVDKYLDWINNTIQTMPHCYTINSHGAALRTVLTIMNSRISLIIFISAIHLLLV